MFAGMLLVAWMDQFHSIGIWTIVILGVLAALSLIIDFVASFMTTKKVGASRLALWGVAIGGLLGIFAGVFGLLLGASIGAMVGELIARKDASKAGVVGVAAGIGFVIGLFAKLLIAVIMLIIFLFAWYPFTTTVLV